MSNDKCIHSQFTGLACENENAPPGESRIQGAICNFSPVNVSNDGLVSNIRKKCSSLAQLVADKDRLHL